MSLCALFHTQQSKRCKEFNLVLQAVNLPSQVVEYENRFYLLVEEAQAEDAYEQLHLYINENAPEEILARPLQPLAKGFLGAYLYGLTLLLIGSFKATYTFGVDWYHQGLAHSEKLLSDQWWRSITALTLHADIAHLVGNIGFGVLFGILVSQYIGSGAAWLSILLAGAAGNAINAYLHQSVHLSIGASTMVFAALGMLGVFALNDRYNYAQRGIRRWLPFIATLALLAFTGTAGERTDVIAHLAGYFCGCLAGIAWIAFGRKNIKQAKWQGLMGLSTVLLIVIAWSLAISA